VASASTNWAVVPEPTAACSAPRAAVFDGTVDLTGIGGGWTAAEVPTVLSFSAISLPSADLTDLVTAEQTPACTAPCDNEVDPGELLAVHRARLLVGRMP
jgi:hypothetical protein